MIFRTATGVALAVVTAACGNLARDVIVEKASPIQGDGAVPWLDAGLTEPVDAGDGRRSSGWRCDRDGGCRRKAEENCNRYNCEDWCQYLCGYIASSECREKVHCRQNNYR